MAVTENQNAEAIAARYHQQKPSHPGQFHVHRQGPVEELSSKLVTDREFKKGDVIAKLEGLSPGPKRHSSVQVSKTEHVELNSDLYFMNHSCDPSAHMDVDNKCVSALKDLKVGDEINFFYPSTEWDMAQPFTCWCGADKCIKTVTGANKLTAEQLNQFVLVNHIKELVAERDQQ
ncbi:hypothetical protein BCR43DRAFT_493543 [Syncephalastrum racemosum]|uniref:SET domain-containing protein n=1 Tax=Syncephalastrum racemosum TaxID=13706 RepID=A0A1X2HC33_SYNRA|nr:hypothetical protein BCR43DRAFT_493543 [Syncephalastrum racemosum]